MRLCQANSLNELGAARNLTGEYTGGAEALEEALNIYRDLGDLLGQANALSNLGAARRMTDDYPGAAGALEEALDIYRDLGDLLGQAGAGQAYILRVPSNFRVTVASGITLTCAEAVRRLGDGLRWEVRAAGKGAKGQRWYAWAWAGAASRSHHLLIRRHLRTGELAYHYCFVPEGRPVTLSLLARAAGLRWPVEEDFEFGKDDFGLDQSQVRLYTAITRHTVLVMAALAICAVTAAQLKDRTDTQAPAPVRPGQAPPPDPGMIPLAVPEVRRLIAAATVRPGPPGHIEHWSGWMRIHQARSRWFHQRTRLERDQDITMKPLAI